MTFTEVIEKLRDGNAYIFTHPHLTGYFYKAPFPEQPEQTAIDSACSAISYYDKSTNTPAMPMLMLYDFDEDYWECNLATNHPLT